MEDLKRSVAGIRGIWGKSLFPRTATEYATAFGIYNDAGKVVVGRDTRTTGQALKYAIVSGLISANCEILDIGICPTPTCQLMVKELNANGGIIVTASHNPIEWNGLKFTNSQGEFLSANEYDQFIDIIDNHKIEYPLLSEYKVYAEREDLNKQAIDIHRTRICNHINVEDIREKKLKVVLDACNGAGSRLLISLLQYLGCDVVQLHCLENGLFPRGAEPTPENIEELCSLVRKEEADIGFAVDPDADRLSIVTERGEALGEEMTLPLVAQHVLKQKGGVVVTNLSTSMTIDYVAQQFNTKVVRTKIGEAHVVSGMKTHYCFIGGEGNGGIIVPAVQYARDTGVGIGFILDYLTESNSTISELASTLPKYYMVKRKVDCPLEIIPKVLNHIDSIYATEQMDSTDGVKIIWDDSWLHIRKSGTEGILRIFTEAATLDKANKLADHASRSINEVIKM